MARTDALGESWWLDRGFLPRAEERINLSYHMLNSSDLSDVHATELVDDHHRECWINHWS
jgi:hypothetical protein